MLFCFVFYFYFYFFHIQTHTHTHTKIVKYETLHFVMGQVQTHSLLIFGQTPTCITSKAILLTSTASERGLVCVVWWHLVSVRTFGVMYDHTFFLTCNCQIRYQATHKMGCQPGVCIWSLQYSSEVWVGIYGLTYSLMTPEGTSGRGYYAHQSSWSRGSCRIDLVSQAQQGCHKSGTLTYFPWLKYDFQWPLLTKQLRTIYYFRQTGLF